jgi:hypothetical protein
LAAQVLFYYPLHCRPPNHGASELFMFTKMTVKAREKKPYFMIYHIEQRVKFISGCGPDSKVRFVSADI